MFIHLRFREGLELKEEVHIFHKEKVRVSDVLQRMSYRDGIIIRLYNEDGELMKNRDVVENARVYNLLRGRNLKSLKNNYKSFAC